MERFAELVGGIALLVLGGLGAGYCLHRLREWATRRFRPSRRVRRVLLLSTSLQLARGVADVEEAVGERGSRERRSAAFWLAVDYIFIAVYWALFMLFAGLLAWRSDWEPASWYLWLGIAAGVLATLTALADVRENVRTENVIALTIRETTPTDVDRMRRASLAKWTAAVATVGLLTALFWGGDRTTFVAVLGWAWAIVTGIGVLGLVYYPLLSVFFAALGVVGLATLVYATFWSAEFVGHMT